MTEQASIAMKKPGVFGGCNINRTSPKPPAINTKVLNVTIIFEEALKLHLAIGECIRKLNTYNRSTTAGKSAALNLAVRLSKGRVTVNEGRIPSKSKNATVVSVSPTASGSL
jgi:hypothetical protein